MQHKKTQKAEIILVALRRHLNLRTYGELAKYLGVPLSTLSAWKSRNSVNEDLIYAKCVGVSAAWLKTGEGPMLAVAEPEEHYRVTRLIEGNASGLKESDACRTVDIFNMVEGGNGAEPEWHEPVDHRAIPAGFLKANIRPVLVRGRSMEPTFKNGAIIGIDQGDKQVIEGEAYAVVLPYSGAAVKRLYPQPDGVLIRSDNKEFPEVKLKKEDVPEYFILGRVCWVVQEV